MSDKRKFKDVVTGIKEAENDVDKVLKAAKLERHEKKPVLSEDTIFAMFAIGLMFAMFALMVICH